MDLAAVVILTVAIAISFFALERVPFPAQPPWLRRAAEAIVAVAWLYVLLPRIGINLPH